MCSISSWYYQGQLWLDVHCSILNMMPVGMMIILYGLPQQRLNPKALAQNPTAT